MVPGRPAVIASRRALRLSILDEDLVVEEANLLLAALGGLRRYGVDRLLRDVRRRRAQDDLVQGVLRDEKEEGDNNSVGSLVN